MQALRPRVWAFLVLVLAGAGAYAATQGAPVQAADHNDPPDRVKMGVATTPDRAADIADVFVWSRGSGATQTTVLAMSFDGPNAAGAHALTCDRDVLYQIHITADGGICPTMVGGMACAGPSAAHPCGQAGTTDCTAAFDDMHTINIRFAQNGGLGCAIEAEFVGNDGATPISAAIRGATGAPITATGAAAGGGDVHLYAGLRDDAFFFDLAGFQATLMSGHLSFTGADSFAGMNTPVIVLEVPTSAIAQSTHASHAPGSNAIRVWGSTARFM